MKFYFLTEGNSSEETGDAFPQISKISRDVDYYDDNGIYAFSRIELPENNPILSNLLLNKQAKITDVLSCAMLTLQGFLMNEKVRNILKGFNLPRHKFYPADVLDVLNNNFKYEWLQMIIDYQLNLIDISMSQFVIAKNTITTKNETPINIHSLDEYQKYKSELKSRETVALTEAYLKNGFEQNALDLFKIPQLSHFWIISEALKNALISGKVSGISILETDRIKINE